MLFRLPGRPWFKPHTYGFGAYPVTWEGWALTSIYVAGVVTFAQAAFERPIAADIPPLALFAGATALLTLVYGLFVWLKTDGTWRWRWGPRSDGPVDVKIVSSRDDRRRR